MQSLIIHQTSPRSKGRRSSTRSNENSAQKHEIYAANVIG